MGIRPPHAKQDGQGQDVAPGPQLPDLLCRLEKKVFFFMSMEATSDSSPPELSQILFMSCQILSYKVLSQFSF